MRTTRRWASLTSIDTTVTHLALDIRLAAKPVSGSLALAGETATEFSGYMGLINALEALRSQERDGADLEREDQG